jgi:hypothetical protein
MTIVVWRILRIDYLYKKGLGTWDEEEQSRRDLMSVVEMPKIHPLPPPAGDIVTSDQSPDT